MLKKLGRDELTTLNIYYALFSSKQYSLEERSTQKKTFSQSEMKH